MISEVDFHELVAGVESLELGMDLGVVRGLCECNLLCYRANMEILAERAVSKVGGAERIAECEGIARHVGEDRVKRKTRLNAALAARFDVPPRVCAADLDVALSVAEMIDRLSIETIKLAHFGEGDKRSRQARQVFEANLRCLRARAQDIIKSGAYHAVAEARTYELEP